MLVLPGFGQDDKVTCPPSLQKPEAQGGEAGSVRRENPGECPGVVSQSQVGKAVCPFLRIVRSGKDDG